jgi:diguanylate cyclase (GGDEF)-like protein
VSYAFSVSINFFENNDYVISFADISDTMVEKLELKKEANIDALTNVYNRVYFNKNIEHIIKEHKKDHMKTGIIFLDIDYFKKVNDTYGHDVGDYVLKKVASLVTKYIRDNDKIVRWGGEEFIIISEIEKGDGLFNIAEHLRSVIENYKFNTIDSLTCSFGCAVHNNKNDILDTIKQADEKLYHAKNSGRNRVEC